LLDEESIDKAIEGVNIVVHVASPFHMNLVDDEDEMIEPAVGGSLSVMRAAQKHKIERVVVTSSTAAMVISNPKRNKKVYDERDWSDESVMTKVRAY